SADRDAADCFVRGSDLVANYSETPALPFSLQLYWRAHSTAHTATAHPATAHTAAQSGWGVDAILSTQTSLLESYPRVFATSAFPADHMAHLSANGEPGPWKTVSATRGVAEPAPGAIGI